MQRNRVERELDEELRATVDLLADEHRRQGLPPDEAHRAAVLQLGGVESVKEEVRQVRAGAFLDTLLKDVRYAARLLVRNPIFTLTAACSLAIGIGATTAIFTVTNGLLLRSAVGVSNPGSLVDIVRLKSSGGPGLDPISYPDYLEVRTRATTLDGVYGYQLELPVASLRVGESGAERVYAGVVTANYFTVLGVPAAAGRTFSAEDGEDADSSPLVVLSHRFWARRFDSDPGVIGRSVTLNGYPLTIVGVAREGFLGMTVVAPDVWVPSAMAAVVNPEAGERLLTTRGVDWLMLGGRLKAGASRQQASAEMMSIGAALAREFPVKYDLLPADGAVPINVGFTWSAESASPIPFGLRVLVAGFLALLLAIVSIVLMIACANLAGVLLARGVVRRREIAVRTAIGAGRARVVRLLLTETVLLFAIGGVAGLVLARVLTSLLVLLLPAFPLPANLSTPLDGRVVAFSLALSFAAALLSGLAPALHASRTDVVSALKDEGQAPVDRLRLRNMFVVAQVAFSILLVIIAAILVRDVERVTSVDRGFDARQVDAVAVNLSMAGYDEARGANFARQLIERVRALPGVESATLANRQPGPGAMMLGGLTVAGVQPPRAQKYFYPNWHLVDAQYFATLRIPLIAGRDFTDADREGAQKVAILGEAAARRLFPGKSAIGQVVQLYTEDLDSASPPATPTVIVGVVGELSIGSQGAGSAFPVLYVPIHQKYVPGITILARTTAAASAADEIRMLVTTMNPNLPVLSAQTLERAQTGPVETQLRIAAVITGSVGVVGLLLAAMGIYGVTAYAVARRTREIGIRLSLGATRSVVVGMILRQGMTLVGIGLAIGLLLGVGISRVLAAQRFGVTAPGVMTFVTTAMLFIAVGLIACYAPLRRATRIGAMEALRYE